MPHPHEERVAVVFTNRKGLKLFGILHTPVGRPRQSVGVLLLSPGVKMRVGPECLYRPMTDRFVAMGFPVFRFDFFGLGDSEGELTEELLVDVYNHIEVGRFVDDALDALDWMERELGLTRVVVSGLCGGAVTGLLAGAKDPRVAGLISLGITPVLASRAADASMYMTQAQVAHARRRYLRSIVNVKAWRRFLTLQSDYRLVRRALLDPILERLRPKPAPAAPGGAPGAPAAPEVRDNANPLFPPAFFKMLATERPMLFIFSGADRLLAEFQEKFVARYPAQLEAGSRGFAVHVIAQANHVLSLPEWQREMLELSEAWLRERFLAPPPARP
jgi:pimeloyl-ACP methyl ester carboxylesterase